MSFAQRHLAKQINKVIKELRTGNFGKLEEIKLYGRLVSLAEKAALQLDVDDILSGTEGLMRVGYVHHRRPMKIKDGDRKGIPSSMPGLLQGCLPFRALEGPYAEGIPLEDLYNIPLYVKEKDLK